MALHGLVKHHSADMTVQGSEASLALELLAPAEAASQIDRMSARQGAAVLASLPEASVREVLKALPPIRAAQILSAVDPDSRERVLGALSERQRSEIAEMLTYAPNTAGALMDPRITAFRCDMTVADALARMRTFKEKEFDSLYLMGPDGKLIASVPLAEIVTADPDARLEQLSRSASITVAATATKEEIVAAVEDRRVAALPVVDGAGGLVGVIRHSTLLSTSEVVATASIQTMVGVGRDERATSPIAYAVRSRLPWLQINLGTAFLAAFVVGLFEGTIAQFTALAVLLPVVAGQSGNAGMQALAVSMRGIALREIGPSAWPRLIVKEAGTGIINGLAIAAVTMVGVFIWSRSLGLVLVIGLAMVIAMLIAGMSGALVPITLKALRQDPATSSSIVLTTVTDVMGFLTFLGLATIFASLL